MNEGFPQKGGRVDVWGKIQNNPIFFLGAFLIQVVSSGAKFVTYASGAIWWQVAFFLAGEKELKIQYPGSVVSLAMFD